MPLGQGVIADGWADQGQFCKMKGIGKMGAKEASDEDYEIITPPTDLRSKVRQLTKREAAKFDPVKAAEAAIERLSQNFGTWMLNETRDLCAAWEIIEDQGPRAETVDTLYQAAHNIKGQALTLGYPLVGDVAARFCWLIEALPSAADLPMALSAKYVEAIRAMVSEGAKDDQNKTGAELLETLSEVTEAYVKALPAKPSD
ncbi:hypothetical protein GCM10011316_34740 [Roseibium aquae]|uniref:Hpt domain-containing protein n=1 Tax=Roseibium aquae TaxID=1323746 RepID=A0A916TPY6_9HYPH|nr:Hpt domain-containing protein [Roseibium aquae]GGB59750.1 hypothetical protein GCM10011316_34740 [Roseibium aquae]